MSANRRLGMISLCIGVLAFVMLQSGCPQAEPRLEPAQPAFEPGVEAEAEPTEEPAAESEAEPATEAAATTEQAAGDLVNVPLGLPPVPVPEDNPITPEKIALGKLLYFDTRLSKDGTISCATCHDPETAWTEHRPTSQGIHEKTGGANSPTVINAAYATSQFWDGRAASLEEQALGPIENPIEMGNQMEVVVVDLAKIPEYQEAFEKAFGDAQVNNDRVAKAIASFERTVLSGNSPYDQFEDGKEEALSESQKRGLELFNDVGCAVCHTPPLFSNYNKDRFYNAGVGMDKDPPDEGRKSVTKEERDLGKFRVPMLREVANTHPYFHDGSVETLEEAVELMAVGGKDNPRLSPMMRALREQEFSQQDQTDLVEFLKALSGEYPGKDD